MKLSIITINLNDSEGLKKTIESVINQKFTCYEFIIIDGGSTDKSINIIHQYKNKIDYWVSEPDKGIYDAMNKGISKAKGEYILMLNSGDCLFDENSLYQVFESNNFDQDILYGDVQWVRNGKFLNIRNFPDILTFQFFWKKSLGHQSTFVKRSVHDIVGLYDNSFKVSGDWKFFVLAICRFNVSYRHIPYTISICDADGMSWNPATRPLRESEHNSVLQEHFAPFVPDYQELNRYKDRNFKNWYKTNIFNIKNFIKKLIPFEYKGIFRVISAYKSQLNS